MNKPHSDSQDEGKHAKISVERQLVTVTSSVPKKKVCRQANMITFDFIPSFE
jgi:hypothetical protein